MRSVATTTTADVVTAEAYIILLLVSRKELSNTVPLYRTFIVTMYKVLSLQIQTNVQYTVGTLRTRDKHVGNACVLEVSCILEH